MQRTELLLGEENLRRLAAAHVLVVGLGGVGAYAAEMICRAGVGRMTITMLLENTIEAAERTVS